MTVENKYPSQIAERFQVRMPDGLRDRIAATAATNNRSMNTEIVLALEKAFPTLEPEDAEIDPNEWREKAAAEIIDEIEQLVRRLKELRSGQASTFRYYR